MMEGGPPPEMMMGYGGPPRDLYELYMTARSDLFSITSFTLLYFRLYGLVDLGKEMLPETYDGLRREAEALINNLSIYPNPTQLEVTGSSYRISTGEHETGLIEVRFEDINTGREEAKDQKATALIPKLKEIDSKILRCLIEAGVIEVKKPNPEEIMMQEVMIDIQSKLMAMSPEPPEEEPREDV